MNKNKAVPNETQFNLIKSLYQHKNVLISGWVAHILALMLSFYEVGDQAYTLVGIVITIIICLRYWDMIEFGKRFDTRSTADIKIIKGWERRYMLGSGSVSFMIGLNAGYSLLVHPTSIATITAISMAFGSLISIVGRNFASRSNVLLLTSLNGLPVCLGLVGLGYEEGSFIPAAAGLLMLPVLFISMKLATFIREILMESITAGRAAQNLSSILDAAVSNMPTGMIMVDGNGKLIMMNDVAALHMGLRTAPRLIGHHVNSLATSITNRAKLTVDERTKILLTVNDMVNRKIGRAEFKTPNGRILEFFAHHVTQETDRRANRTGNFDGTVILCDDITARKADEMRNWRLARFDFLSKLPNRQYLFEVLPEAINNLGPGRKIAFCQFDLDGFKPINDTMGHEAGDEVIQKVAAKMLELQAADDRIITARMGGDEFVIAFKNLHSYEDVTRLFDHAFSQICTAYEIKGKTINLRCSGGVAIGDRETFEIDDMMRKSDFVLYKVKHNPKRPVDHIWGLFTDEIAEEYRKHSEMRTALKEAISDGTLTVAFQPVYRPNTMTIEFCEALVRWNREGYGTVDPKELLKAAEDLGMLQTITRQVLNMACAECMKWPEEIGVSVNFSALDLHQMDCIDLVREALEASGLAAHRLNIEINEAALVKNITKIKGVLNGIAQLGVRITIDDFGAGYSLLNLIQELPLSKVKISRSFIKSIATDEKMKLPLNALIQLSAGNNIDIVVEGVETGDQLTAILKNSRVDMVQGYHLGRPVSAEDVRSAINVSTAKKAGHLVHIADFNKKDGVKTAPSAS